MSPRPLSPSARALGAIARQVIAETADAPPAAAASPTPARPTSRLPGTAIRDALEVLVPVAEAIADGRLDLILEVTGDPTAVLPEPFLTIGQRGVEDAFLRAVAALDEYRHVCERRDTPYQLDLERYVANRRSMKRSPIDPLPAVAFALRLLNSVEQAAAEALDDPPTALGVKP